MGIGPMPRRTRIPDAEPEDHLTGSEPRYELERVTEKYLQLMYRETELYEEYLAGLRRLLREKRATAGQS